MALAVGTKAPEFKLFNTDKKEVSLSGLKGKNVILSFFPAAFTGVCTEQMCTSRDDASYLNDMNAVVLGISVDSPFTLGVFKEKNQLNFDLLSDFNKQTIHEYDMYFPNFALGMRGVAKRGTVLIDKDGVVQYSEETANPGVQVNFEALKAALGKLK